MLDKTINIVKNNKLQNENKYIKHLSKKSRRKEYPKFNYLYKTILNSFLFISFVILSWHTEQYTFYLNSDIAKRSIKVGFFTPGIKYGGRARVISILLNYLSNEKNFILYLITLSNILQGEYFIPKNIKRIGLKRENIDLFQVIKKEHLDILVYNCFNYKTIENLNKLKNTKIIYYDHSSFAYWIYSGIDIYNSIYQSYKRCRYVISLVPLENDYLFKKWGINSILMHNLQTFEYNLVIPSNLSSKEIIMIGRTNDHMKRFELGIRSMETIIKEIPECKMNIIGSYNRRLSRIINDSSLENYIHFTGFHSNIGEYLKSASLHIFTSFAEAYPMVLSETKIFGIPTILCGLDYLSLAKGGTVIIYDDNPETIAKEAIKILKEEKYRKRLGKQARKSMKKIRNNLIAKKWAKLLLSVYKDNNKYFHELVSEDNKNKISKEEAEQILNNQFQLWIKRIPLLKNVTLSKVKSFLC